MLHFADSPPILELPLFSAQVPAGFPSPADDHIEGKLDLNEYLVRRPAATFFVRASGESMRGIVCLEAAPASLMTQFLRHAAGVLIRESGF